ncbi:iron-containing alcohol dehydrogenase [Alteromonas facilis]|uniref:iron-containing alcohol dehydrogenase n=1 Tax=Alteromonas facilis TaxID=2048004 RepID=UPI000C289849|nr:iron-containing alcohol dehydrogenase [Alteromonas facilis]
MIADIQIPGTIKSGGGALNELTAIMRQLNVTKPCIIADPIMVTLGWVAKLTAQLEEEGISAALFSDVMPEPDDRSIVGAVELVKQHQCNGLVALGGGSAIDSAKAIALLATHGGAMRDYKVPHVISEQSMPVIAIPTTAGTGSECTRVTVISDSESAEKMLCMGPGLMPKCAILDYELTLSVPFRVAADTGLDALTHAIEAYVSKKANPFSDQMAISAMRLIAPNLLSACLSPDDKSAKEAMMLGASLAGMAFSNASVALVHGMSRPIGVHFHVPHGMSNAMLLPLVTEYSLSGNPNKYAECAKHLGLVDSTFDIELCHKELMDFLNLLNTELKVPKMSEFGIDKAQYANLIDLMATQALASGSPANNPKVPEKKALMSLYEEAYS